MRKLVLLLVCLILLFSPTVIKAEALAKVEYNLPYPGLLPDSPLYFLKIARDNFMLFILRQDKQKAFYYLFLSDKRLAAGETLFNNNQKDLGATTVLKSAELYSLAVDMAVKLKNEDLTTKLVVAGAKHEEVINELLAKTESNSTDKLLKAASGALNSKNRVMELLAPR